MAHIFAVGGRRSQPMSFPSASFARLCQMLRCAVISIDLSQVNLCLSEFVFGGTVQNSKRSPCFLAMAMGSMSLPWGIWPSLPHKRRCSGPFALRLLRQDFDHRCEERRFWSIDCEGFWSFDCTHTVGGLIRCKHVCWWFVDHIDNDWRQWQEQRQEVLAIEILLISATSTLKTLVFFCVLGISCFLSGAGHELLHFLVFLPLSHACRQRQITLRLAMQSLRVEKQRSGMLQLLCFRTHVRIGDKPILLVVMTPGFLVCHPSRLLLNEHSGELPVLILALGIQSASKSLKPFSVYRDSRVSCKRRVWE